jgi:uncharacterized protein YcnI
MSPFHPCQEDTLIRTISRLVIPITGAATLVALTALPAVAHVSVNPREVPGGGYAALTFRMPNERDNAHTTKLEVVLPAEQPFASVRVKRQPGWTYEIEKAKLDKPIKSGEEEITEVVRTITWTAQGKDDAVKPSEFVEFDVSVGRLPDSGELVFKAIQTYDNGEVVRWIEQAAPGAPEPKNPAPVLKLLPKPGASASAVLAAHTDTGDEPDGSSLPMVFSILGLLFGAGGLATGLLALRRARTAS